MTWNRSPIRWAGQALDCSRTHAGRFVGCTCSAKRQIFLQAIADQETRLRAVAGELESGGGAGLCQRGEIHRGGDVLQARPGEHVVTHVVLAEGAQGAVATLRLVVLATRITVIDEQHRALLLRAHHRLDPVRQLGQHLAAIAFRERLGQPPLDVPHRGSEHRIGRPVRHPEPAFAVQRHVFLEHLAIADREARRRQRIDHLVGEQHAIPRS